MRRRWTIMLSGMAFGTFYLLIDYHLHKTACAKVSDDEALAILKPTFEHMKSRSRPEDVAALRLVPNIHRDSNYPSDDPNHSVWIELVNAESGQLAAAMHLFTDCGIETWGYVSLPSVGGTQGTG